MAKFSSEKYPGLILQDDKGVWARFERGEFETTDAAVIKRLRALPQADGVKEGAQDAPASGDSAPAKSAPKGDWVAWAMRCGAEQASAEAATRDQLIEQFGDATPKE
jgi:hypothetical protein